MSANLKLVIPDTPSNTFGHVLHYVLEAVEGIEVGMTILKAHIGLAGELAVATGWGTLLAGALPVAGQVGVFVALGNAHRDAQNNLIKGEILSGFSHGVVLGANGAKIPFVKNNFVKKYPVRNSVYPELGKKLQNEYNRALLSGYAQGKALSDNQARWLFEEDLHPRLRGGSQIEFSSIDTEWNNYSELKKRNYYIDVAAIFRYYHLR